MKVDEEGSSAADVIPSSKDTMEGISTSNSNNDSNNGTNKNVAETAIVGILKTPNLDGKGGDVSPLSSPMPNSALLNNANTNSNRNDNRHRRLMSAATAKSSRFEDLLLPVDAVMHANLEDEAEMLILAALEKQHANEPPFSDEEKQVFGLFRSDVPANVFDAPDQDLNRNKEADNRTFTQDVPPPQMPPLSRQATSPRVTAQVNYDDGGNANVATGKPPRHNPISEMSAVLSAKNKFKKAKQHRPQVPSLSSRESARILSGTTEKLSSIDIPSGSENIESTSKEHNQVNGPVPPVDLERGTSVLLNRAHRRNNTQFTIGDRPSSPRREQTLRHVDFDLSDDKSHKSNKSRSSFDAIDMTHFDSLGLGIRDEDVASKSYIGNMSSSVVQRMRKRRMNIFYIIRPDVVWAKVKSFLHIFTVVMLPLLGIAFIVYYFCGNPEFWLDASLSWWLIFVVRQMLTWYLANATEYLVIRCLIMRTQLVVKCAGPLVTLAFIQSRGWPFILSSWAIWDLILLYGGGNTTKENFAEHWLYWQRYFDLFNRQNPGNGVLHGEFYLNILISAIVVGFITSLKRTTTALYFGRKTYAQYKEQLQKLLRKMVILSDLGELAEAIDEEYGLHETKHSSFLQDMLHKRPSIRLLGKCDSLAVDATNHNLEQTNDKTVEEEKESSTSKVGAKHSPGLPPLPPRLNTESGHRFSNSMWNRYRADTGASSKFDLNETEEKPPPSRTKAFSNTSDITMDVDDLTEKENPFASNRRIGLLRSGGRVVDSPLHFLDKWDDPKIIGHDSDELQPSIRDVLEFRKAIRHLEDPYPFSTSFGLANTRENCVESSLQVYLKLLLKTPGEPLLPVDTIGLLATTDDGDIDEDKARRLVRMFRADQSGSISQIMFVQAIDNIYKRKRLLLAALKNSQRLDYVLENIFNVLFFVMMFFVVIAVLGFDPMAVLLSFTTIFLSFTFAFGGAASKYTEGIISIVIRRPFEVGDRISISDPFRDSDPFGSPGWFVEDLNIFFTTVRYGATNEVSTISNYSLANARIVNCARSRNARILFPIKVGIATPRRLLDVFKSTIENFIKDRPSKWVELEAFRTSSIEPDLGYIQFTLSILHQSSWQETGELLDAKTELASFCLETAKKLGITYESPPLPVNINIPADPQANFPLSSNSSPSRGATALAAAFASGAFKRK